MGLQNHPSTFFVPGLKGFFREECDYISRNFPDAQESQGGIFFHNGLRTNYSIHRAQNEKRIILGLSGANALFPLSLNEIKTLNDEGNTLVCLALHKIGPDFMGKSEALIRAFLTDPHSPAYMHMQNGIPAYIVSHSSSGPILVKLYGEDNTGRTLRSRFNGAAFIAPIFDVPFASRDHSPEIAGIQPLRKIFEFYADRKTDVPVTNRLIVKAYLALTAGNEGFMQILGNFGMTLGHVRQIQKYSWNAMDNFRPEHMQRVPAIVMAGNSDPCTCWQTSQDMAWKMGADFKLVQGGGHDLIKNHPERLSVLTQKVESIEKARTEVQAPIIYIPVPTAKPNGEVVPFGPDLSDRARFAYQSGARFLNTTASFF